MSVFRLWGERSIVMRIRSQRFCEVTCRICCPVDYRRQRSVSANCGVCRRLRTRAAQSDPEPFASTAELAFEVRKRQSVVRCQELEPVFFKSEFCAVGSGNADAEDAPFCVKYYRLNLWTLIVAAVSQQNRQVNSHILYGRRSHPMIPWRWRQAWQGYSADACSP